MQERHNSSALAMELHLSCTDPSIWSCWIWIKTISYFWYHIAGGSVCNHLPSTNYNPHLLLAVQIYVQSTMLHIRLPLKTVGENFGIYHIFPRWNLILKWRRVLWDLISHLEWCHMINKNCIEGLAQDCYNSIAKALELLQSCAKSSIWNN